MHYPPKMFVSNCADIICISFYTILCCREEDENEVQRSKKATVVDFAFRLEGWVEENEVVEEEEEDDK